MGERLRTTIAGSLPKPAWLAEPERLWAPWTLRAERSLEAKDDATLLAIKLQEEAGIDIVSDGEQARQHFVHGFLEVDGVDFDRKVAWASATTATRPRCRPSSGRSAARAPSTRPRRGRARAYEAGS